MKKMYFISICSFIACVTFGLATPVIAQVCNDPNQCDNSSGLNNNCTGSCTSCNKTVYYPCDPLYPEGAQCSCQASSTCCFNGSCTVCTTNGDCYTNGCPDTGTGGGGGGGATSTPTPTVTGIIPNTPTPTTAPVCSNLYRCRTDGVAPTPKYCEPNASSYDTSTHYFCGASAPPTCEDNLASNLAGKTTGTCYASLAACGAACINTTPTPTTPSNTCIQMFFCKTATRTCQGTSDTYNSTTKVDCPWPPNTCAQNLASIQGSLPNTGICYTSFAACDAACNPPPPPPPPPTPTPVPSGDIRVRSMLVPSNTVSCNDVTSSTEYLPDSVRMSPPGTTKAISGTGAYTWWLNAAVGSHTFTSNPGASYAMKLACWTTDVPGAQGSGYTASVADGGTLTWNLGYIAGYPWYQTQGGDVYGGTTIRSYIPSLAASGRYFNTVGTGGAPGVVTYGTGYDFDDAVASAGESYVSTTNWLTNETLSSPDYYAIMYHRFGSPTAYDSVGTTWVDKPNAAPVNEGAYYINGNLVIDGVNWTVGNGESIVVLVNGTLTIRNRINITGTGFVAFIVNGDITIDSSVGTTAASSTPVIEGIYITSSSGRFSTGISTTAAARKFVGKGTFIAGNFALWRDLDADAQNMRYPAELFIYNPELMMRMPEKMKDLPVSWQEVAP